MGGARVRAGLRNARAKGKHLGRPRANIDANRLAALRREGRSLKQIAAEAGCSAAYVHKTLANLQAIGLENAGIRRGVSSFTK